MFGDKQAHSVFTERLLMFALVFILSGIATNQALAQGIDTIAPIIELEELADGVADQNQVFTVQIVDDIQLKDATLYFRREGQLPFTPAPMEPLGSTGFFSVSIPTEITDFRTIEYYIQARDEAGNRTVSGFAFDPYRRVLRPSPSTIGSSKTPSVSTNIGANQFATKPPLLQRRWVQITLGVLAAGVVASLANSGGSNDSQVVPLTFNLE